MIEKTSYETALEQIEEAVRSNATEIDLSRLKLVELPPEIGKLTNLRKLDLYGNSLKTLPKEFALLSNLEILDFSGRDTPSIPPIIFKLTNLKKLHLGNRRLTKLPKGIEKLKNLEHLGLSSNKLKDLSNIEKLKNLKKLDIRGNPLRTLPLEICYLENLEELIIGVAFPGEYISYIESLPAEIGRLKNLRILKAGISRLVSLPNEISRLKNLRELHISGNKLLELPISIGELSNLETLDVSMNKISTIPNGLGNLRNLKSLDMSSNKISSIPEEIGQLTNLIELNLGSNQIQTVPIEIRKLTNLTNLSLKNNQIRELPVTLAQLKYLAVLDLQDNQLPLPPEILEKTNDPQSIISFYISLQNKKRQPLLQLKNIVVGQGSVGKTSLIKRIISNEFKIGEEKTQGIVIDQWQVDNHHKFNDDSSKIRLNIWDFGGQEIMHATHQFFLTKRSLYLLVLDSRLTQEENRVEYWLKIIQSFGGESPVLIIGNKIDQHPLDIDRTGLQKKYPSIVGILETSAATGAGIEELKAAITEQVNSLPHVRDLLPETWFIVKTKLEELGNKSNFITHDKYVELCTENEVSDETSQRTLIGFLHDLGVVLHFQDDPRLEALGILNPQWVTNGVYKILNSQPLFKNKGVLTVFMLDDILNLPEYPRGKRLFIVDMMKKFELCYDIELDKTFLVPDLLPKDEPAGLKFNGIPAFEYAYPVLPSSVITRFIVRMNQKIDDGLVWRTGVVLQIGENKSLVKADLEDRKITIAVDGLEHTRRDALSAIRYQLDEIHGSIKGLNPQKKVPVPNARKAEPLKYEYLLKLERAGQETLLVENGNDLVTINIRQLLSGIESEARRKEEVNKVINNYNIVNIGGNADETTIIAGDENEVKS